MEIKNLLEAKELNGKQTCLFYHDDNFKIIIPEGNWMSHVVSLRLFKQLNLMPKYEALLKVKEIIFNWLSQNDYLDKYEIIDTTHPIFESGLTKETIALVREFKINQILNDK